MRVTVLAVGKVRPPYADDVAHYRELLAPHCRLELIELKEGDDVERRIPDRAYTILLDEQGETMGSEDFAQWLEDRRQSAQDLCFVVGGPYGTKVPSADFKLSFGPMTMPHQLARVVLLEQLYRGHKILAHHPYHH